MLRTQKSTFLNSDFFAKSEIQNIITISKIMKLVQKLNSQQQIEHGGHFYWRRGYLRPKPQEACFEDKEGRFAAWEGWIGAWKRRFEAWEAGFEVCKVWFMDWKGRFEAWET